MERFLAHLAHAGYLDERQQVNIYTAKLLEPLKTDIKLLDPQDMETAMLLAQAYERHLAVVAEANKAPTLKLGCLPPPKVTTTITRATTPTTTTMGVATPTSRPFKRLTAEEMTDQRRVGLCFNCKDVICTWPQVQAALQHHCRQRL
jgi:hypothetical protein